MPPRTAVDTDLVFLRAIGRGDMATVYLAREPALRRLVAVKVLSPELCESARARRRFQREAEAAARISHPNVAPIFSVGTLAGGCPFLVMPYVRGTNLDDLLQADGPLPSGDVLHISVAVVSALVAAHEHGVIHRDLRPANVLHEDGTGRILLTDFGIAAVMESGDEVVERLTLSGESLGSPGFASVEQRAGGPITDRTDIYSLGALILSLLNGVPPADSSRETLEACRRQAGKVDAELSELAWHCLAERPEHRPSAWDVKRRLDDLVDQRAKDEGFWGDLWRRKVPAVTTAAGGLGFGTLEAVDQLIGHDLLPPISYPLTLVTVIPAFLAAVVLAWFHGARGPQRPQRAEVEMLLVLVALWVGALSLVVVSWNG